MPDYETHADLAIKRQFTVSRECYLDHLTFRRNDTVLFTEIFGPQVGLKRQWQAQGATPGELDFSDFRFQTARKVSLPVNCGRLGACCHETGEDAECVYYLDDLGRKLVLYKNVATLPLPVNYPVTCFDDWRKVKDRYRYAAQRIADGIEAVAADPGAVRTLSIPGGFDEPRQLFGEEALCYAVYDQPELIHDMLDTIRDCVLAVIDELARRGVKADILFVHDDMAGKSGSLWSPETIGEMMAPYYRAVSERAAGKLGVRLFDQDSDGDMNSVLDAIVGTGINCIHPNEPGAGMDIVAIRGRYGRKLALLGGLDKYVIAEGKAAIDRELETKVPALLASGGIEFGLDHRIPIGSSLENYRYYLRRFREIAAAAMPGGI
ncbi:MAG: uroporphyrinogen decarboxylase family protein [Victivallaceae bacterium]